MENGKRRTELANSVIQHDEGTWYLIYLDWLGPHAANHEDTALGIAT
jgi:hypothetical protein